jgi:hypothetical protein
MKNKAGRPTDYDPKFDYDKLATDYLNNCGREQTKLPKISEFARIVGVNEDTIVEWAKKWPKFSATYKRIFDAQKEELIDDGLFGGKEVNAGMAIFLLKVNHGMIETEKKMLVGKDDETLIIKVIEEKGRKDE